MPIIDNLTLRVNGLVYERIRLQHGLVDGLPTGPLQIVVKDDPIGVFTLTDAFVIELKEEGREWQRVSLAHLLKLVDSLASQ